MESTPHDRDRKPPSTPAKERFQEPTLTYVKPTLVEYGKVTELTKMGFFGTFYP